MKSSTTTLFAVVIVCLIVLGGCSHPRLSHWDPDDYSVRSGDTLYSIAWRYEIDPDDLARWNQLSPPYLIRPGDRLHTKGSDSRKPRVLADSSIQGGRESTSKSISGTSSRSRTLTPQAATITVKKGDTLYSLARRHGLSVNQLAGVNELKPPYMLQPGQRLNLKRKPAVMASSNTKATAKSKSPARTVSKSSSKAVFDSQRSLSWQWPVKGKVVTKFNPRKNGAKGIDIAGSIGSSVKAAAPGKVVYSGNGLISYGNLLIIKHSQSYLSAYAHNRKLLVKEGTLVKAGQKIAELGKSGIEKPKLHFEIRKNGKPVNPMRYLPSS